MLSLDVLVYNRVSFQIYNIFPILFDSLIQVNAHTLLPLEMAKVQYQANQQFLSILFYMFYKDCMVYDQVFFQIYNIFPILYDSLIQVNAHTLLLLEMAKVQYQANQQFLSILFYMFYKDCMVYDQVFFQIYNIFPILYDS